MVYELAKTVHILSATILFGTGIGIAFFFLMGMRSGDPAAAWFAARTTALADMIFTLTSGIIQPLSGLLLIHRAAIAAGAHYCDLADARAFVCGIGALDAEAREAQVAVLSGASSVPCLTAAFLDEAAKTISIESVDYGITAAQQTNRGLGTASAILSYVGRPFTTLRGGTMRRVFGWQGMHSQRYPELGRRWFGYCDIPDLDLFPARYPSLRDLRFSAGHEIALLHLGTWLLSWGVRLRLLPRLDRWAKTLLRASFLFDPLGSGRSGFHMAIRGRDGAGSTITRHHWMIARQGHGPNIPCTPAILLARRLARGQPIPTGARPCLDLIDLQDYLAAIEGLDISVICT